MNERPLRIVLPARSIRRIDAVLDQGSYESRSEFISDAVEQLLDLVGSAASETVVAPAGGREDAEDPIDERGATDPEHLPSAAPGLDRTAYRMPEEVVIRAPDRGFSAEGFAKELTLEEGPLFGLHNRDWPSLWAAEQLCRLAADGPVSFEGFLSEVSKQGWVLAEVLEKLNQAGSPRLTAMLPTNRKKERAAEEAFRAFAVGSVNRPRTGERSKLRASGPFFLWRLAVLNSNDGGELEIAPTRHAYELLEQIDGISVASPHAPEYTRAFFSHLSRRASSDFRGFQQLLEAVSKGATREEVLAVFTKQYPDWTPATVSTNAAGWTARSREWGLIEIKLQDGKYVATPLGHELLDPSLFAARDQT